MLKKLASSKFGWLLPVGGFLLAAVLFNLISRVTNPSSHAYAGDCIARSEDGATYRNTCGYEINFALCLDDEDEADYSSCPVTRLGEGDSYQMGSGQFLETDVYGNRHVWACKTPFVPRMKPSNSNQNLLRKACGRKDD
tara:strand:- start:1679 stop:2095 length:417 start_codon:yes stop_codon:yes gene_type:complete